MALENIQNYIIGIIIFCIVITGGTFIIGQFYLSDSSIDTSGATKNFSDTMNKATEVTVAVNNVETSITGEGGDTVNNAGALGVLNALIGSAFDGLQAIFGSLSFMGVLASDTANIFGIPAIYLSLIALIATVVIAFAIWSAIMRV
jgi:hypothetical protein